MWVERGQAVPRAELGVFMASPSWPLLIRKQCEDELAECGRARASPGWSLPAVRKAPAPQEAEAAAGQSQRTAGLVLLTE